MFENLKYDNDDDALRLGEKWLLVIANIILIPAIYFTDYENVTEWFGTVDPVFMGWYALNLSMIVYSATRSRVGRVSYTGVSANYHATITDQEPVEVQYKPKEMKDGDTAAGMIYDDYHIFVKGVSMPPLSYKRTLLISPKTYIDTLPWGPLFKCKLRRYVGFDQRSLPPHLTEALARQDPRKIRFRFGATQIYFADEVDKEVARFATDGYLAPDGNVYSWVRGGIYNRNHDLTEEESLNRQAHGLKTQIEVLAHEYEQITGQPVPEDAGMDEQQGVASNG